MTAVSIALLAALVVSTIANIVMVSRLRAAKRREEEMLDARKW